MSDRLSGLKNKTKTGNVRPYSLFVKLVKIILPLIIMAIVGLLIIWPQITNIETAPLTQEDVTALKEAESENRLLNPVYNTLDSKGKPFSLTAEEARQNRSDNDKVYLVMPSAEMTGDENTLYLQAGEGEYDQGQQVLILKDGVTIKDSQNNVLTTDELTTSITDGKAQSNAPATLTTDQGKIEGQAVIIDRQNQTTTFQGPAKAVINQ